MPQNEHESPHMIEDDSTPVKACRDLAYHVNDNGKTIHRREAYFFTPSLSVQPYNVLLFTVAFPFLISNELSFR